jgi:sRNA-binding regulator protein Hfq
MANSRSVPQSAASPDAEDAETTWLHAARGKVVRVRLLEGKTLVGQLLAFDPHTLVLKGAAPVPLLVYKHNIAYLAVDEPAAES